MHEVSEEIITQYMNLTNKVIKGVHSIGFINGLDSTSSKDFLQSIKARSAVLFVYEKNKLIASGYLENSGYLTTQHYGKISKVMVDPEYQGKGIGKVIMEKLEEKAKELGYTHIFVSTWDVDYIIKFYKKCGYKQVGIIPEFVKYKGKYHDSHNFFKKL
jgi:ribosomal protein S18 acetylase RimI-like enzyme